MKFRLPTFDCRLPDDPIVDRIRRERNTSFVLVMLYLFAALVCFAIAAHAYAHDDYFWAVADAASGIFWTVLAIWRTRR